MCLKSAPCQTSQRPETEPLDLTLAWDARKSEYCKIFGVGFWILGSAKCPPTGCNGPTSGAAFGPRCSVARTSDTGLLAASLIPFAITTFRHAPGAIPALAPPSDGSLERIALHLGFGSRPASSSGSPDPHTPVVGSSVASSVQHEPCVFRASSSLDSARTLLDARSDRLPRASPRLSACEHERTDPHG